MSQTLTTASQADQRISAAVLGLIAQRRLTVAKVARLIDVSRTTMYHRVNNERPWEAGEVDRLAQVFDVSRDSLYEGRAEFAHTDSATVMGVLSARSSTERASDYGSEAGWEPFQAPSRGRRERRRHMSIVPLYLVGDQAASA